MIFSVWFTNGKCVWEGQVPQFVMSNASLLQLLVINLTLVTHAQTPTVMEPRRILEIRSYTLRPETRDYFHRLFIEKSLPLLQQARIDVVGYGASLHDSNSYFLMRSYASIKQRQESEDSFYTSDAWLKGPRDAVLAAIVTYTTMVIEVDEVTLRGLRRSAMGTDSQASDLDLLIKLNADYIRSVETSDAKRFNEILAEDFLCSRPDGSLVDKNEFLRQISLSVGMTQLQAHGIKVRMMGEFAIIHAGTTFVGANGKPTSGRYTDVWARRDGKWLAVAAHVTRTASSDGVR